MPFCEGGWRSRDGDLSPCTADVLFSILPLIWILFVGQALIRAMARVVYPPISVLPLKHMGLVLFSSVAATYPLLLVFVRTNSSITNATPSEILFACLHMISWTIATGLAYQRSRLLSSTQAANWIYSTSACLTIASWWPWGVFWGGSALIGAVRLRSAGLNGDDFALYSSGVLVALYGVVFSFGFVKILPCDFGEPSVISKDKVYGAIDLDLEERESENDITDRDSLRTQRPWDRANCFSKLTFWYLNRIIALGYKKPLELYDLYELPARDQVKENLSKFQASFELAMRKHAPAYRALAKSIWALEGRNLSLAWGFRLIYLCLEFVSPVCLSALVNYSSDTDTAPFASPAYGYLLVLALGATAIGRSLSFQWYIHTAVSSGFRIRAAGTALIFRKAIHMTAAALDAFTPGKITNIMSTDLFRLDNFCFYGFQLVVAPLQLAGSFIFLVRYLGWQSTLAGVGVIIIITPLQFFLTKYLQRFTARTLGKTDQRVQLTQEAFIGIRAIKYGAWENSFTANIHAVREQELRFLWRTRIISSISMLVVSATPTLIAAAAFYTYVITQDVPLRASDAFASMLLLDGVRYTFAQLPITIQCFVQTNLAMTRWASVMDAEEVNDQHESTHAPSSSTSSSSPISSPKIRPGAIFIQNRSFYHSTHDLEKPTMIIEELSLAPKSLNFIIGPVGSGKSFLLSCIMGEVAHSSSSRAELPGCTPPFVAPDACVAFVPQTAWIFNDTVRANILFGAPYNEVKYKETLECCALNADLKILPHGDLTEIGERGINLSGGQKQRVSLARAIYRRDQADVFVFDDPFSALDSHVGRHVFTQAFLGLLQHKTRVVVTHQLALCPQGDLVIVMGSNHAQIAKRHKQQKEERIKQRQSRRNSQEDEQDDDNNNDDDMEDDDVEEPEEEVEEDAELEAEDFINARGRSSIMSRHSIRTTNGNPFTLFHKNNNKKDNKKDNKKSIVNGEPSGIRGGGRGGGGGGGERLKIRIVEAGSFADLMGTRSHGGVDATAAVNNTANTGGGVVRRKKQQRSAFRTMYNEYHPDSDDEDTDRGGRKAAGGGGGGGGVHNNNDARSKEDEQEEEEEEEEEELRESMKKRNRNSSLSLSEKHHSMKKKPSAKIIDKEERMTGGMGLKYYMMYWRACGFFLTFTAFLLVALSTAGNRIGDYWLTIWTNDDGSSQADHSTNHLPMYYIQIFAIISLSTIFITMVANLVMAYSGISGARTLHNRLVEALFRAPVAFFDTTPLGRVLNRSSRDVDAVDNLLPTNFGIYFDQVLAFGSLLLVIAIVTRYMVIAFAVVLVLFYWVQQYYRKTSREMKRLDSIHRTPVFQNFTESLEGAVTLRAFRTVPIYVHRNDERVDVSMAIYYLMNALNRWLAIRLDFLAAVILVCCGIVIVSMRKQISPSMQGLLLGYALQLTGRLTLLVRQSIEVEVNLNSVERTTEYANVAPEPEVQATNMGGGGGGGEVLSPRMADAIATATSLSISSSNNLHNNNNIRQDDYSRKHNTPTVITIVTPPTSWPVQGAITFSQVSLRYREGTPFVLRGVDFAVRGGCKVGVVGRTGAGKSSLMAALFRMTHVDEGTIWIDGINILQVPVRRVRERMSIIPQDPVLFTGTVRYNLDPLGRHSGASGEDAVWRALHRVHLDNVVSNLPSGLNSQMVGGAGGLSRGQRQLLCLARALLNNHNILLLDEATASVDFKTDALVQDMIRREFAECTVIAIAHRVDTISDYDMILGLDHGKVVEYDSPANLLADPDSLFARLSHEHSRKS